MLQCFLFVYFFKYIFSIKIENIVIPKLHDALKENMVLLNHTVIHFTWSVYKGIFLLTFSLMHCKNHTDGMPRGDFNIYFASGRRGYVRAEEYVYFILKSEIRCLLHQRSFCIQIFLI